MKKLLLVLGLGVLASPIAKAQYCTSGATSLIDSQLAGIDFKGDNNTALDTVVSCSANAPGLIDFTGVDTVQVTIGNSYWVGYELGTCNNNYTQQFAVYADLNRDTIFQDSELLGYHTGLTVGTVDSIQIEIPWYSEAGYTRIRIVNRETSSSTPQPACGTYAYGSTHDYILDVQGSAASLCTYPVNLMASGVDYNQASFSWSTLEDSSYFAMVEAGVVPTSSDFSLETSTSKLIIGANNISPNTSYDVYVYVPCGGDTAQISFTTLCAPVVAPYSQTFDGGDFYTGTSIYSGNGQILGDCFEAESDYPYGSYEGWLVNSGATSTSYTGPGGDASTYGYGNYMFYESSYGTSATLSLPTLNVSALSDPFLSFDYHYYGSTSGKLRLKVSNDQGLSWIEHDLITSQGQTSETDPYKNAGFSLAPWLGDTAIRVQLEFVEDGTGGSYSDFAIDNISVDEAPACYNPVATLVGTTPGVTTGSADFAFLSGKTLAYSYTEVGSTTTLANGVLFNNSYSFTGLAVNKAYEFSFYNICTGSFSDTTVVQAFVAGLNPCAPQTAPYIETFEITSLKRGCWSTNSDASVDATVYIDSAARVWNGTVSPSVTTYSADSAFAQEGSTFALLGGIPNDYTDYGDITSGVFDFTGISSLQIDWMMATGIATSTSMYSFGTYNYTYTADFELQYRTSPTSSWITVAEIDDTVTDGWEHFSLIDPIIDLSSQMQFRFYSPYHAAPAIAIDSVSFKQGSTCVAPINLTNDFSTQGAAQVSWTGISSNYIYEAGIVGQSSTLGGSTSGDSVIFSGLSPKTTYWIVVSPNCGTGVASPSSDTLFFSTDCDEISTFPYVESFESNSIWELCWTQEKISGTTNDWDLNETGAWGSWSNTSVAYDGSEYAEGSGTFGFGIEQHRLISPVIDASALTTLEVSFYYGQESWGSDQNLVDLQYRLSDSDPWVTVWSSDGTSKASWEFAYVVIPVTSATMQIAFMETDDYGYPTVIDYITLDEGPTCLPVNLAGVTGVTSSSAYVTVDASPADYEIYVELPTGVNGVPTFTQATGTSYSITNDSAMTITGLAADSTYGVFVRKICGTSVGDTSDWRGPVLFKTLCAVQSLPLTEMFEGTDLGCWSQEDVSGSNKLWTLETGSNGWGGVSGPSEGSQYLHHTSSWGGPHVARLISPVIDVDNINTMDIAFKYDITEWAGDQNEIKVYVRSFPNGTWTEYLGLNTNTSGTWADAKVTVNVAADTNVQVAFDGIDKYGYPAALDSIYIEEGPFCPEPANVTLVPTNNSVTITWDSPNGTNSGSNIEWGALNFAQGTGAAFGFGGDTSGVTSPFTLTGLSPDSTYSIYIQDSCSNGDVTAWVGPLSFSTLCDAEIAPYVETFDQGSVSNCWSNTGGELWLSTMASFPSPAYGVQGYTDHTNNGGGALFVDASGASQNANPPTLKTSLVDISGLTNPELEFYVASNNVNNTVVNDLIVNIYDANGKSDSVVVFNSMSVDWQRVAVDLTNYASPVLAEFIVYMEDPASGSLFYHDIVVDDISFAEERTCFSASNLSVSNINANDATLSWDAGSGVNGTDWIVTLTSSLSGSVTVFNSTSTTMTVSGLNGGEEYCAQVQEICSVTGDTTNATSPVCFTTACGVTYAPYTQDFASYQYDFNCWTRSSNVSSAGSGSQWEGTYGDWMIGGVQDEWGNTPSNYTWRSTSNNYAIGVNGSSPFNAVVTVESPEIDVTSLVKPRLEFHTISGQDGDTVVTWLGDTISNGQNTLVVDMWDGASWNDSIYVNASDSVVWDTAFFELNQFNITGPVKVRFTVHKTAVIPAFDDILLDNFSITDDPAALTCTDIDTAYAFDITCADAMISWGTLDSNGVMTQGSSDTNRIGTVVYLGTDSVDMMANAKYYTSDTALYVDGLLPGVDYYFWAMDSCISGNTSKVIGSYMFTAATAPLPILPTIAAVNDTVGTTSDWTITLTGDTTATYTWDINGTSYNGMVITPSFTSNGTVTATLTVTNDCGSVDTTISITVTQIGLEELALDVSNIYPNPSNGAFNVEFTSSENLDYRIELMDAMGRLVSIKEGRTSNRTEVRFDTNLPAGVYIVKTIVGKQMNIDRVTIRR